MTREQIVKLIQSAKMKKDGDYAVSFDMGTKTQWWYRKWQTIKVTEEFVRLTNTHTGELTFFPVAPILSVSFYRRDRENTDKESA